MCRRRLIRLCCLIAIASLAANTATAQKGLNDEESVMKASAARRDAYNRRDLAALDRQIADDCLFSTDDGTLVGKAGLIKHLKNLPVSYERIDNARDFTVKVRDNVAVMSYRPTAHEQFGEADIVTEQHRTETWIKRGDAWILIAVQTGNLPKNFRKPIKTVSQNYKDYVGTYEWRPNGETDVVTVRDGRLWSRLDGEEDEYLPLGTGSFFIANDLGTITFTRDAVGHINGYTYHRVDGQEIRVRRVR